ncbi:MAG: thiol peroxidase [Thermodesulfobacteriota bacterium]
MAKITFKGQPIQTCGELPALGQQAPDFVLTDTELEEVRLSDFYGTKLILNIFPSIETPVCAESVRRFNAVADQLDNTRVLCISRDLPFAHKRFNMTEGLDNVTSVSEMRNLEFGEKYGVRICDGPLAGLLARAVMVIDENTRVIYTQQVPEIGEEPDYEPALQVARTMGAETTIEAVCTKTETGEHARFGDADDACDDGRAGKL